MKPTLTLLAALLLAGTAGAGDVYVTRDAQGNPVYTDTPQSIPAQKLDVHSASTDPVEVKARYDEEMKQAAAADTANTKAAAASSSAARARALTAEDQAKRCIQAREHYQAVMNNFRLYEEGPTGERRYLTSEEIETARANAQKNVNEFCGAN